jgi:chromosome segregation ATPase
MANGIKVPDQIEQRFKKLEAAVRSVTGLNDDDDMEIGKLQESVKKGRTEGEQLKRELADVKQRLEPLKDVLKKIETLELQIAELTAKHAELTTKHEDLAAKHAELSGIVDEIKNPKSADEIAEVRLPQYRGFSLDELKVALSKDRPDVLVEIASRLDLQNDTDSKVLANLFTFVEDEARMAELVTFAGSKANPRLV